MGCFAIEVRLVYMAEKNSHFIYPNKSCFIHKNNIDLFTRYTNPTSSCSLQANESAYISPLHGEI